MTIKIEMIRGTAVHEVGTRKKFEHEGKTITARCLLFQNESFHQYRQDECRFWTWEAENLTIQFNIDDDYNIIPFEESDFLVGFFESEWEPEEFGLVTRKHIPLVNQ